NICFFFSSRRRHTRFSRDWSSDVCSSDLLRTATLEACRLRLRPIIMTSLAFIFGVVPLVLGEGAGAEMRRTLGTAVFAGMLGVRSEERRVGKECRDLWRAVVCNIIMFQYC